MVEKDFYTITELAKVLGISRVSVFKKDLDLKKLMAIIKH